jgi:hydrocephalus-inducing protein
VKLVCNWQKISLENAAAPDWDDSMKVIKFVRRSTLMPDSPGPLPLPPSPPPKKPSARGKSPARPKAPPPPAPVPVSAAPDEIVRITEVVPEPVYSVEPGRFKDLLLRINAVSDFIKYQIDTTEIAFAPTMMFQTRSFDVRVTNPSSIRFEYAWTVLKFESLRSDYAATRRPPFSVQPSSGYIDAGQGTTFQVNFKPEEVDDFTATLRMNIPFLASMEPPSIFVSAFSRRPLCHFNVEMSDYLSAGRRHPDYTEPLPEGVKVIELFSPAVGVKRFKRFEIVNPTSSPYDINWIMKNEVDKSPIECETRNAFLSSGKRYSVSFSYTPVSVKTLEVQFEFSIPEHHVAIPVLVVGRIMPNV